MSEDTRVLEPLNMAVAGALFDLSHMYVDAGLTFTE